MKKLSISIKYKKDIYKSAPAEYDEEEEEVLRKIVQKIVEGKSSYFSLKTEQGVQKYFPSKILAKSIITVIEE